MARVRVLHARQRCRTGTTAAETGAPGGIRHRNPARTYCMPPLNRDRRLSLGPYAFVIMFKSNETRGWKPLNVAPVQSRNVRSRGKYAPRTF